MGQPGTAFARSTQNTSRVAELARFFPEATPVRIPVQLARSLAPGNTTPTVSESTTLEFGTTREVLFGCRTPLEFGDRIHLRNSDGTLDVDVSVVAVQYHPGQTIVAARFLENVPNWIVKS